MPSGSGAADEPDWEFWKDFSKYNNLPRNRKPVGSFTVDIFSDSRDLGQEDNGGALNVEDDVVLVEATTVPIGDQTDVVSNVATIDPLSSNTWKAPVPAKKRKKENLNCDNGLKDLFINLENLIKVDSP